MPPKSNHFVLVVCDICETLFILIGAPSKRANFASLSLHIACKVAQNFFFARVKVSHNFHEISCKLQTPPLYPIYF